MTGDETMADPAYRPDGAGAGDHGIARCERFDRDMATGGEDFGAFDKAGWVLRAGRTDRDDGRETAGEGECGIGQVGQQQVIGGTKAGQGEMSAQRDVTKAECGAGAGGKIENLGADRIAERGEGGADEANCAIGAGGVEVGGCAVSDDECAAIERDGAGIFELGARDGEGGAGADTDGAAIIEVGWAAPGRPAMAPISTTISAEAAGARAITP